LADEWGAAKKYRARRTLPTIVHRAIGDRHSRKIARMKT
jgi:hypothetical protein